MGLIIGIVLLIVTHIWTLCQLKNFRPYEYETMFCRDVRAQLGMFAYKSDLEETRQKLSNKKSKF